MAIYHFSAQVISRSGGGNALAAAAYRAGEKIQDHNYTKKDRVNYTEILTPENAPEWAKNRESLWSTVEAAERRKDAQLCREINMALPLELKPEERQELAQNFCRNFTQLGMVADLAIHGQDTGNPHAHIMLTMRELKPEGFGPKSRDWNRRELVEEWREAWAKEANLALERAGHEARIDHRTLAAQGIDREPTIHLGKAAKALSDKAVSKQECAPPLKIQLNAELAELAKTTAEIGVIKAELVELEDIERKQEPEFIARISELAIKALPNKIEMAREEWKKPYIEFIERNGKTVENYKYCIERAELDASEDGIKEIKDYTNFMNRELRKYDMIGTTKEKYVKLAVNEYRVHYERIERSKELQKEICSIIESTLDVDKSLSR